MFGRYILNMYICGMSNNCHQCQSNFSCALDTSCWCCALPPIIVPADGKSCLCPSCLKGKVQDKIQELITNRQFGFIKSLGPAKHLQEDVDFYYNEDGYMVFTEWYHLRRGHCCENDCKHCAYKEQAVHS